MALAVGCPSVTIRSATPESSEVTEVTVEGTARDKVAVQIGGAGGRKAEQSRSEVKTLPDPDNVRGSLDSLEARRQQLVVEITAVRQQKDQEIKAVTELEDSRKELERLVSEAEGRLTSLEKKDTAAKRRLSALENDAKQAAERGRLAHEKATRLESAITAAEKHLTAIKAEHQQAKEYLWKLRKDAEILAGEVQEHTERLAILRKNHDEATKYLKAVKDQIATAERRCADAQEQEAAAITKAHKAAAELRDLQQQASAAQTKLHAVTQRIAIGEKEFKRQQAVRIQARLTAAQRKAASAADDKPTQIDPIDSSSAESSWRWARWWWVAMGGLVIMVTIGAVIILFMRQRRFAVDISEITDEGAEVRTHRLIVEQGEQVILAGSEPRLVPAGYDTAQWPVIGLSRRGRAALHCDGTNGEVRINNNIVESWPALLQEGDRIELGTEDQRMAYVLLAVEPARMGDEIALTPAEVASEISRSDKETTYHD